MGHLFFEKPEQELIYPPDDRMEGDGLEVRAGQIELRAEEDHDGDGGERKPGMAPLPRQDQRQEQVEVKLDRDRPGPERPTVEEADGQFAEIGERIVAPLEQPVKQEHQSQR